MIPITSIMASSMLLAHWLNKRPALLSISWSKMCSLRQMLKQSIKFSLSIYPDNIFLLITVLIICCSIFTYWLFWKIVKNTFTISLNMSGGTYYRCWDSLFNRRTNLCKRIYVEYKSGSSFWSDFCSLVIRFKVNSISSGAMMHFTFFFSNCRIWRISSNPF